MWVGCKRAKPAAGRVLAGHPCRQVAGRASRGAGRTAAGRGLPVPGEAERASFGDPGTDMGQPRPRARGSAPPLRLVRVGQCRSGEWSVRVYVSLSFARSSAHFLLAPNFPLPGVPRNRLLFLPNCLFFASVLRCSWCCF